MALTAATPAQNIGSSVLSTLRAWAPGSDGFSREHHVQPLVAAAFQGGRSPDQVQAIASAAANALEKHSSSGLNLKLFAVPIAAAALAGRRGVAELAPAIDAVSASMDKPMPDALLAHLTKIASGAIQGNRPVADISRAVTEAIEGVSDITERPMYTFIVPVASAAAQSELPLGQIRPLISDVAKTARSAGITKMVDVAPLVAAALRRGLAAPYEVD